MVDNEIADETRERGASVAVAFPARTAMQERVAAGEVPASIGRRLSSSVSGCATLLFAGVTGAGVIGAVVANGWLGVLMAIPILLLCGGATATCGFLTWRWARSLPPMSHLALTEREKDEVD